MLKLAAFWLIALNATHSNLYSENETSRVLSPFGFIHGWHWQRSVNQNHALLSQNLMISKLEELTKQYRDFLSMLQRGGPLWHKDAVIRESNLRAYIGDCGELLAAEKGTSTNFVREKPDT